MILRGDRRPIADVDATLRRLAASSGPILVGPWLSEVGYELLYWIPFLSWAIWKYRIDPARLVIVSRGGCHSWYAHLAPGRYLDVFAWYPPEAFRLANLARMQALPSRRTQKQLVITAFDHEIMAHVTQAIGETPLWLHPMLMYRLFLCLRRGAEAWLAYLDHRPFDLVPALSFAGLPPRYTAVRFYSSTMCPDTPAVRAQIRGVLEAVAAETPIVLLETGIRADDHEEIAAAAGLPVVRLDALMTPATNLEVQTRAIAGASQFVGTYGGFAYLAPFLGIDAEGFHGPAAPFTDKMLRFHLEFARGIFRRDSRYGALVVTPLSARPRLAACHV